MAGANSNIQITDLDFDTIKNNLKTFLRSQNTLQDYDYEGSALSTLLDVLAYNTQYNAYYLNMVGNEMFLDSAILRDSVVSQAKALNYTPKSVIAPSANVTITVSGVTTPQLTLPRFSRLMSEAIDGVNYTFIVNDSHITDTNLSTNRATFSNVLLKQGVPATARFVVNNATNPTSLFTIQDSNVDTTTLLVSVTESSTNSTYQIYNQSSSFLTLNNSSTVYFLQEGKNGQYQVYFGDDILGKKLKDGNIVNLTYISSSGSAAAGANSFIMMDTIGGFSNTSVTGVVSASAGADRESIASIKFQAPKSYGAQNRAVTKEDYITAIQQNNLGYSFDAVNVWGGEQNIPPAYGKVFISLKPTGSYNLSQIQKELLIRDVIKPISVLTVVPIITDPDYTYLQITANVLFDPKKTNLSSSQIQSAVKAAISSYSATALNTFNSTFSTSDFNEVIKSTNQSILANEISVKVQKKFLPNITTPTTYNLYYGTPLKKGMFETGISTSPSFSIRNPLNLAQTIDGIFIEEVPSSTGGVETISILNPGFSYQSAPSVTIRGDGTGATAYAVINNTGTLREIVVTNAGTGYTSAIATVTAAEGDTTGQSGAVIVNLQGRYGTLRTYYNNTQNGKTILNNNIGTINYEEGIITLNNFNPLDISNSLGQFTVSANPTTTIISSSFNRIITVDTFDPNAIIVNVTAKNT
jgi:hypothetical protein